MKVKNEMWEPLWKNKTSKMVSKDESLAIQRLQDIVKNRHIIVETVLDVKGEKTLRFKKKYGASSGIDLYDYVLLGPIVFNDRRVFCKQYYTIGKSDRHNDNMMLVIEENEIAVSVKNSLFDKKVLRQAKQNRSILERLYDKSS